MRKKEKLAHQYDDPLYWKQCYRKRRYKSRQQAVKVMHVVPNPKRKMPSVYKCRFCREYHVGHTGWRNAKRELRDAPDLPASPGAPLGPDGD